MTLPSTATPRIRVTPKQAKAENARRELAARYFPDFSTYVDHKFILARHTHYLAEKLEQVVRFIETGGKEGIGRLMILMPPRHGKTELASIKLPGWMFGKLPDGRIILTSYGADLATRNSRLTRDLVGSNRYQAVFGVKSGREFPVMVAADSHSAQTWDLAQPHRGGTVATGVGGGITGLGATLLVIDDPFKNREEAESQSRRDLVDDWYKSSAYTRLETYGAVILFHTRWHPDDLAGRLIRRMVTDPEADQWDIVCLPALALSNYPADVEAQHKLMLDGIYLPLEDPLGRTPGQALWPERFPQAWLESRKANIGSYDFEALYQQMPYSREGGMFKREWFTIVDSGPGKEVRARVMYWDKAATQGGGKRTSGVIMSKGRDGFYYVEFVVKGQLSSYEREQLMIRVGQEYYKEFGPFQIWHPQDPASAGIDSAQYTNINMAEAGLEAHFEPVTGDKETRAGPFSSACESGKVRLVRGGWNQEFTDEYASFPKGAFSDQVDAGSSAFNKLVEMLNEPEIPEDQVVYYEERVAISPV